jgi:ferrous iron transport protein B
LSAHPIKIALAGNPNSGKTSVFNQLTGLSQKVGNFPGVTVEKVSGKVNFDNKDYEITDFPGIYSLYPKSEDERVSVEAFTNKQSPFHPDIILFVADYGQLQRNLLLFTQLADLKIPIILAINKADLGDGAVANAITREAEKVLGVKTLLISAHTRQGLEGVFPALQTAEPCYKKFWKVPAHAHISVLQHTEGESIENLYAAYVKTVNNGNFEHIQDLQVAELEERTQTIEKLTGTITSKIKTVKHREMSGRIDRVLTHKLAGPLLFVLFLYIIFQSIFKLAQYPMDAIEAAFGWLGQAVDTYMPPSFITRLLAQGILPGIAGVVIFLPQILFLFFFLSVMEESGYMARVSFLSDKLMNKVGLNGKSVVPLLSGAACAIPAMMAARNIENKKDRLITLLVTPLISCSARLPVYILLISLIIPQGDEWFIFSQRGLLLMGMYAVGVVFAVLVAGVFKLMIKNESPSYFVMELPDYQWPQMKNVANVMYIKAKSFVVQAGKIILIVSIVLWFLASYAPGDRFAQIEQKYALAQNAQGQTPKEIENKIQAEKLGASYAGELGKFIEPAIRPLGYDWKIGIALVSSFAAREVFVGTMATIYSLGGDDSDLDSLQQKMAAEKNPDTGKPVFSIAVALSLMMFYAFALQCVSTVAVMYKETGGIKWPLIQFLYLGVMAYLAGFLTYNLLA